MGYVLFNLFQHHYLIWFGELNVQMQQGSMYASFVTESHLQRELFIEIILLAPLVFLVLES